MKKQTKGKRTPPRRKPVRMPKAQKTAGYVPVITQHMRDEVQAEQRAIQESMPPDVLAEYLRISQLSTKDTSPEEDARWDEIYDKYHDVSQEVLDRHVADIVREREQKAAQDQQDGVAL